MARCAVSTVLISSLLIGTGLPMAVAGIPQPQTLSFEEFAKLSSSDQKAFLVRVFEYRLDNAKNLHYIADVLGRSHQNDNGKPGLPCADDPGDRLQYEQWQLGASYRLDTRKYRAPDSSEFVARGSTGFDANEGNVRSTSGQEDGRHKSGRIGTTQQALEGSRYRLWLDGDFPYKGDFLFRYLVDHRNTFEVAVTPANRQVRLTVEWQPSWAAKPGGKRELVLDPERGFLPVRSFSRWDGVLGSHKRWREETLEVKESKLVGDVWMPTRYTETIWTPDDRDNRFAVYEVQVSQIDHGTVKPSDLEVPFTEGMTVYDEINAKVYLADAQGKPVKYFPVAGMPMPPTIGESPHPTSKKFVVLIISGVLILLVACLVLRRWKKARAVSE